MAWQTIFPTESPNNKIYENEDPHFHRPSLQIASQSEPFEKTLDIDFFLSLMILQLILFRIYTFAPTLPKLLPWIFLYYL
jgi:hypothetical protein